MSPARPDRAELFRGGPGHSLGRALRRVCAPFAFWEGLWFYERDLTRTDAPAPHEAKVPLEVRLATVEEMRPVLPEGPAEADRRFAAGDLCFIGLHEGRIVHHTWLGTQPTYIPEIGARIKLQPRQTYLYHSLTEEASRGSGVQAAVGNFIVRYQKSHGFERHFLFVKSHNFSARQVLSRIQPPPLRVRVVRRCRIVPRRGLFVMGVRRSDPLFEVESSEVRAWSPLGYWLPGNTE